MLLLIRNNLCRRYLRRSAKPAPPQNKLLLDLPRDKLEALIAAKRDLLIGIVVSADARALQIDETALER